MKIINNQGYPALTTRREKAALTMRPGFMVENLITKQSFITGKLNCQTRKQKLQISAKLADLEERNFSFSLIGQNSAIFSGFFIAHLNQGFINGTTLCLAFVLPFSLEDYLFLPGLVYNGTEVISDLPAAQYLGQENNYSLNCNLQELTFPGIGVYWRKQQTGFFLSCFAQTPHCRNTINFTYYQEKKIAVLQLSSLPLPKYFTATTPFEPDLQACYLGENGTLQNKINLLMFEAEDASSLFTAYQKLRDLTRSSQPVINNIPLTQANLLLKKNLLHNHWQDNYFCSAVCNTDNAFSPDTSYLNHYDGGTACAYLCLQQNDKKLRQSGCRMLNFISRHGSSPNGLFYSLHNNDYGLGDWPWAHITGSLYCCYYLLKSVNYINTDDNKQWQQAAIKCLDSLVRLYREYGEFGFAASRNEELCLWQPGSAAGALAIACLVLGRRQTGNQEYLAIAREAGTKYASFLTKQAATGSLLNSGNIPDSSSAANLLASFTALYEETKDKVFKTHSLTAARLFSSFMLTNNICFPENSQLGQFNINPQGMTLIDTLSQTYNPMPPLTAIEALVSLHNQCREHWLLRLLADLLQPLSQLISSYHSQFGQLQRGMVVTHLAGIKNKQLFGNVNNISHLDAACAVLARSSMLPGIYLDPETKTSVCFDSLEISVNYKANAINILNPTSYSAKHFIKIENNSEQNYELAPGETKKIIF